MLISRVKNKWTYCAKFGGGQGTRGNTTFMTGRYYLTPVDVKNICQRYKSNKRFVITFIHFDFLQWLTIRYDLIIHILEGIGINVYLHMQVLKHPL